MKVFKIVLLLGIVLNLVANQVTLVFKDGELVVESKTLEHSITLKHLLENQDNVDQIPMPNIDKATGSEIVWLLLFIENNQHKNNLQNLVEAQFKPNPQEIVNLLNAANYLDISVILNALFSYLSKDKNLLFNVLKEYKNISDELFIKLIHQDLYQPITCAECIKREYDSDLSMSDDASAIVALGKYDGHLYIFDKNGNQISSIIDPHQKYVGSGISSDGSTIVALGKDDGCIYIFDKNGTLIGKTADQKYYHVMNVLGHDFFFASISISSDGSTIAALDDDDHLYVFNRHGKQINSIIDQKYEEVTISADGSTIVALGNDHSLYIFDRVGTLIGSITDQKYSFPTISSDGSTIFVSGEDDGHLYILDKNGNKITSIIDPHQKYGDSTISSDGSTVVALGDDDQYLYIFDRRGTLIGKNTDRKYFFGLNTSSDGSVIIVSGNDHSLYIFDRKGTLIGSDTDRVYFYGMPISSDGSTIAAIGVISGHRYIGPLYIFDKYYVIRQFLNSISEKSERDNLTKRLKSLGIN